MDFFSDEYFMREALKEAYKAKEIDEVPVGAVVVCNNTIIARAHNLTEKLQDATAHAEMQAITAASNYLGSRNLTDCSLYVTLEPCLMCAGALFHSRLYHIVFGATDEKFGYSHYNTEILHPRSRVKKNVMGEECAELLITFFNKKRDK